MEKKQKTIPRKGKAKWATGRPSRRLERPPLERPLLERPLPERDDPEHRGKDTSPGCMQGSGGLAHAVPPTHRRQLHRIMKL